MVIYLVIAAILNVITTFTLGSANPQAFGFGDVVAQLLTSLLLTPMYAGLFMIALKHSVGSPIRVGELFNYYDKIIPLFVVSVIVQILILLGLLLLILPGIYLVVTLSFALPLVFEKNMSPLEAVKTSRAVVQKKWFSFAGFS